MARTPEQIQRDIDRLKAELKNSKDANYYAAQAKKNATKAKEITKKYSKKVATGSKTIGNKIAKFLTTK